MTEKRLRKKAGLNVLCTKEMETYPKYNSKYNSTRQKKKFSHLMIPSFALSCNKKTVCINERNKLKKY